MHGVDGKKKESMELTKTENLIESLEVVDRGVKLILPASATIEQWFEVLAHGILRADRLQWAIGEWFLLGEDKFGDEAYQMLEHLKYSKSTLLTYTWVVKSYGRTERNHQVPFDVYQSCAGIEDHFERDNLIEAISKSRDEYPREIYREGVS